jgi:hypothetical protein
VEHGKSNYKREVYRNRCLRQKRRKVQPHVAPEERQEQTELRISRRKEIVKPTAEVNEEETTKIIQKINKTEVFF